MFLQMDSPRPVPLAFPCVKKGMNSFSTMPGEARTAVFNLGHNLALVVLKAQADGTALGHDVSGVAKEIVENMIETTRIDRENDVGHSSPSLDVNFFTGELLMGVLDDFSNISCKTHRLDRMLCGAFTDAEQFVEHVIEALHLLMHALLGLLAKRRAGTLRGGGIPGQEDDAERVF